MSQSYSGLLVKLEKIDNLRTIWKNETADFTKWLSQEENLNLLGEAVGMDLERIGTEERVGDFQADIFAKELEYGKTVIIENQLEESNHKHLGQIITYAAGKEAGCIIWIVKRTREEHAKAIEWLNSHLDQSVDLFLIEIELWRIGDSKIAPKFNIIEKPNQWGKEQKEERLESAAGFFRKNFWSAFCDVLSSGDEYRRLFTWGRPSSRQHFDLRIGSSKGHVYFSVSSQKKELWVCAYVKDREAIERISKNIDKWKQALGDSDLEVTRDKNLTVSKRVGDVDLDAPDTWSGLLRLALQDAEKIRELLLSELAL